MKTPLESMVLWITLAAVLKILMQIRDEIHAGHGACERAPAAGMAQE